MGTECAQLLTIQTIGLRPTLCREKLHLNLLAARLTFFLCPLQLLLWPFFKVLIFTTVSFLHFPLATFNLTFISIRPLTYIFSTRSFSLTCPPHTTPHIFDLTLPLSYTACPLYIFPFAFFCHFPFCHPSYTLSSSPPSRAAPLLRESPGG